MSGMKRARVRVRRCVICLPTPKALLSVLRTNCTVTGHTGRSRPVSTVASREGGRAGRAGPCWWTEAAPGGDMGANRG